MLRPMTALPFALLLACGSSSNNSNPQPNALTCTNYCGKMATVCTGSDVQYQGLTGTCDSYCGTTNVWPVGTAGDASGNSLACRITHVGLAAAATAAPEKTAHCGHAGPSGGDTCGTWCENYCFLALKNCTGANGVGLGFTDNASCLAACANFPANGAINAPSGNTVQCRIYHAGAAGAAPVPHCGHAQVISSSTVGGTTADGPCN